MDHGCSYVATVQEMGEVGRVAGQDCVTGINKQGDMSIHHVPSSARSQKLADALSRQVVERSDYDPTKNSEQVRLAGPIAPDLGKSSGACASS